MAQVKDSEASLHGWSLVRSRGLPASPAAPSRRALAAALAESTAIPQIGSASVRVVLACIPASLDSPTLRRLQRR